MGLLELGNGRFLTVAWKRVHSGRLHVRNGYFEIYLKRLFMSRLDDTLSTLRASQHIWTSKSHIGRFPYGVYIIVYIILVWLLAFLDIAMRVHDYSMKRCTLGRYLLEVNMTDCTDIMNSIRH